MVARRETLLGATGRTGGRYITDYVGHGSVDELYRARIKRKERIERLRSQLDEANIMLKLTSQSSNDSQCPPPSTHLYVFMGYGEGGISGCII